MKRSYLLIALLSTLVLSSCNETGSSSSSSSEPSSSIIDKYYAIKWLNYDGTLLESESVKEGTLPTFKGKNPTHPVEEHYTYTFSGWDKRVNIAKKDETYKAVFSKVGEDVEISWLDEDGSLLIKDDNEYGKLPHYPNSVSIKNKGDKKYVFKGWSPELVVVDQEATYTAKYEEYEGESFIFDIDKGVDSAWGLSKDKRVNYSFNYDDGYFYMDNKTRDDDFALLSLGLAGFNSSKEDVKRFLETIHFDNIVSSSAYDIDKYDQIGYTFATKDLGDDVVIAVASRGFEYGKEMLANFIVGSDGEHQNFKAMSEVVYLSLMRYIASNVPADKNIKLWINGYSRSAAISGFIAKLIYENINKGTLTNIDIDDIYSYCFEAPTGGDINNINEYPFIHNYTNINDVIPLLPPPEFGFKIYGEIIQIYNDKVSDLLIDLDSDFTFEPFKPYTINVHNYEIKEDKANTNVMGEYWKLFMDSAMSIDLTNQYLDLSTRERYDEFSKHVLPSVIELLNTLTYEKIVTLFDNLIDKIDTFLLLLLSEDSDALIAEIEDLITSSGIECDFAKLDEAIGTIYKLFLHYLNQHLTGNNAVSPINGIVTMINNAKYIVAMHSFEASYVLINNLINNAE